MLATDRQINKDHLRYRTPSCRYADVPISMRTFFFLFRQIIHLVVQAGRARAKRRQA